MSIYPCVCAIIDSFAIAIFGKVRIKGLDLLILVLDCVLK